MAISKYLTGIELAKRWRIEPSHLARILNSPDKPLIGYDDQGEPWLHPKDPNEWCGRGFWSAKHTFYSVLNIDSVYFFRKDIEIFERKHSECLSKEEPSSLAYIDKNNIHSKEPIPDALKDRLVKAAEKIKNSKHLSGTELAERWKVSEYDLMVRLNAQLPYHSETPYKQVEGGEKKYLIKGFDSSGNQREWAYQYTLGDLPNTYFNEWDIQALEKKTSRTYSA